MPSLFAIIGASYLQLPLVLKAREMGLRTLCFSWPEGAVCKNVCDEFIPLSITEKDRIADICANRQVRGVATIASDVAVPTVACVATRLGLPGNSEHSAYLSTNKNAMRAAFRAADICSPVSRKVCSEAEAREVFADLGWPLIVKPADRSGSLGVEKVEDVGPLCTAVRRALDVSLSGEAVVEQFIGDAREISIEGISHEGVYHVLAVTDKLTTGAPHFVELAHHQPSKLPQALLGQAIEQVRLGVAALDIREGATHAELMISPSGNLFVTEIGARMGGDFIGSDLVSLSTGYDFVRGVIEVALGTFDPPCPTLSKCAGVWFYSSATPSIGDVIRNAPCHPEIVRAEITDPVLRPLARSADRSGYFIYQADRRLNLADFVHLP